MIEIACTCDGLPAHSHVPERATVRFANGHVATIPAETLELNAGAGWEYLERHPPSIRIWVDWKAVARRLSIGTTT